MEKKLSVKVSKHPKNTIKMQQFVILYDSKSQLTYRGKPWMLILDSLSLSML